MFFGSDIMKKCKSIPVIIAAVITLALAACAKESGNSSSQTEQDTIQVTTAELTSEPVTEIVTEPSEPDPDHLYELLNSMSLEEKVGQMFIARYPDENAAGLAAEYGLGGYIMFGKDFDGKTKDEVIASTSELQQSSKIPMLIGVDEEGGTVVRVSSNPKLYPSPFLAPKDYPHDGDNWDAVEKSESDKADLLLSLGINVNLAPVCDITKNEDSFMYDRSFADNPKDVSLFVVRTVGIYSDKKLGSVLKHFPGYGDNADTHTGSAVDDRSYSELANNDFIPFENGINAGADSVLVSHNIVTSIDPDLPASLSDKIHQVLRRDLNFKGVIMTDDLSMEAIADFAGDENAAVLAVKGGNDLVCCTDFESMCPAVISAIENEEIPIEQIDQSVMRILKWKQKLGLLDS